MRICCIKLQRCQGKKTVKSICFIQCHLDTPENLPGAQQDGLFMQGHILEGREKWISDISCEFLVQTKNVFELRPLY